MIDVIKRYLGTNPFEPFSIVTSGGVRYRVASRDHANIDPTGKRVVIWFDDGGGVIISGLHITAVEEEASASQAA